MDDGSTFVHRAAVWAPSFGLLDLDPEPAKRARATAINQNGTVVGIARGTVDNATARAAAWTPLGRADATQGADSLAQGVSDRGWIVGTVSLGGHQQPALWLLGGRLVELPTPGGNAGGADDVNDSGFIIGGIRKQCQWQRTRFSSSIPHNFTSAKKYLLNRSSRHPSPLGPRA
jgi:hypothetical protein